MSTLLKKLQDSNKAKVAEESAKVVINKISSTSNPEKVILKCDEGDFFVFASAFPNKKIPVISQPIKAELLLREKGEYVNVISVSFETEQLGKYNLVATFGNAVVL